DNVDRFVRPLAADIVGCLLIDPRVVTDDPVLARTLGTHTATAIARLQMDAAEVELAEHRIEDLLYVFKRLWIRVAHRMRMRRPLRQLAPHRRIVGNNLVEAPAVRAQPQIHLDASFAARTNDFVD